MRRYQVVNETVLHNGRTWAQTPGQGAEGRAWMRVDEEGDSDHGPVSERILVLYHHRCAHRARRLFYSARRVLLQSLRWPTKTRSSQFCRKACARKYRLWPKQMNRPWRC